VRTPDGNLLYNNGRAIVSINGRKVKTNYKYKGNDILYQDPRSGVWVNHTRIHKQGGKFQQGGSMTQED
jgi:hypothetical protein